VEQQVTVIAIEGDQVLVHGRRATACGKCAGKSSCATMGSWKERVSELRVKNSLHATVGDEIVLDVPDALLLKVSFQLYALPMIFFILTGVVMRSLAVQLGWPLPDALAAVSGILAVLASYAVIRGRVAAGRNPLDARMVKVIRSEPVAELSGVCH